MNELPKVKPKQIDKKETIRLAKLIQEDGKIKKLKKGTLTVDQVVYKINEIIDLLNILNKANEKN